MVGPSRSIPAPDRTLASMDSVRCVLHPLALVSVCDSETRLRKGGSKLPTNAPLIGLLFGPVTNGVISICDGANAVYEFDTERGTQLNLPRIAERKTLWCTVYPSHELVGWFSVGVAIEDWHARIHQEIIRSLLFFGNPVFLLMNPAPDPSSRILPLTVYAVEEAREEFSVNAFGALAVSMDALPVEKIALDQIVKSAPNTGTSALETQNTRLVMSLNSLRAKVDALIDGVNNLKATGEVDSKLLRMVGKICAQLPDATRPAPEAFEGELLDCLMLVHASLAAKNVTVLNDLSDKFLSTYARRGAEF